MNRYTPHRSSIARAVPIHREDGRRLRIAATVVTALLVLQAFALVRDVNSQPVDQIAGAPVDLHSGTCEEPVLDPLVDAGELGSDTLEGIQDDELSQIGLQTDEEANARGVDLDGNGTLDENEIIGGIDADAPVSWASVEFEEAIDVEQPTVVIVHADADAGYSTFIACGSITDTQPDDEGRRIVPLAPQGEYTVIGYSVLGEDNQTLSTYMFEPGDVPSATPDPLANAVQGPFPVDIHTGTCSDWTTEPVYDLGDMQVTNVAAEGQQEPGDVSGEIPEEAADLGPVYMAQVDETEFNAAQLLDEGPFVIAVHQSSEDYETLVACGPVLDFFQSGGNQDDGGDATVTGTMIVPLLPAGESNLTGVALIGGPDTPADAADGSGTSISAYLWQCEPVQQPAEEQPTVAPTETPTPTPSPEPSPTPTQEPTPTPTEEPTATPEPTATEEPTVVVEETEEVLASTATALAEQEEQVSAIELGDEEPGDLTATVDQPLVLNNTSDTDRVFRVEDLQIDETIPAGEEVEIQLPEDTEPGEYAYQVLENDEPVFEGTLTVE